MKFDTPALLISLLAIPVVVLFFLPVEQGLPLVDEDGVIENFTALFFFAGAVFCAIAIARNENKFLPILWFILCFVFLGEEVSWFQRQLDYNVESIEAINAQGEFNLHNLDIFQVKSQHLFRLGFFLYFILLPLVVYLLDKITLVDKIKRAINYIPPSMSSVVATVGVLVISFAFSMVANINEIGNDRTIAEFREFIFAFVILTYTYFVLFKNSRSVKQD